MAMDAKVIIRKEIEIGFIACETEMRLGRLITQLAGLQ